MVQPGWQPVVVMKDAIGALVAFLPYMATAAICILNYILPILGRLAPSPR